DLGSRLAGGAGPGHPARLVGADDVPPFEGDVLGLVHVIVLPVECGGGEEAGCPPSLHQLHPRDHPRFSAPPGAQLPPIGTSVSVLDAHMGAVRSFELGGTSTTAGRRWAARCSCGVVATTGAWPEALAYLSKHR